jgi:SNF2 family DNA or RNA helicase
VSLSRRERVSLQKNISYNNVAMQLRKVMYAVMFTNSFVIQTQLCNHPYLCLDGSAELPSKEYDSNLVPVCGKLAMLERLLKVLLPKRCLVLVFSQMTSMLDLVEEFLVNAGIGTQRHGCLVSKTYVPFQGSTVLTEARKRKTEQIVSRNSTHSQPKMEKCTLPYFC